MQQALIASAILAAFGAAPSLAAPRVIDFAISGAWTGGGNPYGVPTQPSLLGSVTFDDQLSGISAVTSLTYVTGTKTWSIADLTPGTQVTYSGLNVDSFTLLFGPNAFIYSNNLAGLSVFVPGPPPGFNSISCRNCVSFKQRIISAVPESQTWALMIIGFGLVGGTLRRKKAQEALN